jgi:hypothetical protein
MLTNLIARIGMRSCISEVEEASGWQLVEEKEDTRRKHNHNIYWFKWRCRWKI